MESRKEADQTLQSEHQHQCLIVGGGWCNLHRYGKPEWRNKHNFYTIDCDPATEPDLVADITDLSSLVTLIGMFKCVYFECFPASIETSDIMMTSMFQNAYHLLEDKGMLVYHGGGCVNTPIPGLLKAAGFDFSIKKGIHPARKHADRDRGAYSVATKNIPFSPDDADYLNLPPAAKSLVAKFSFFDPDSLMCTPIDCSGLLLSLEPPRGNIGDMLALNTSQRFFLMSNRIVSPANNAQSPADPCDLAHLRAMSPF